MRRAYPKGAKREMTADWKARARERLAEMGKSADWLDSELKVTRGMVRKMLGPRQNTSALVDDVCRILEIAPPVLRTENAEEQLAMERLRKASEDTRNAVLAILGIRPKDPT
jgi:hypothetical protein